MARKSSKSKRVEPRFEDKASTVKVSKKDRVGTPRGKAASRSAKGSKKRSLLSWFFGLATRTTASAIKRAPRFTYWSMIFGLRAAVPILCVVGYYAMQLPSVDTWAVPERPPNMRIISAEGDLLGNRGLTGGKALRLEEMSPYIAQAVISIEDHRFHSHIGFDPIGFSRAMFRNAISRRMREGGSTITQQLAKNLFLKPERTVGRKVQELLLAFWLELKYSKAEILELYLNRVYFGSGATGVDAAARRYFGKSAKHVTVGEAALLAGLLKAPSRLSPAKNPDLAQARAKLVLSAMQREGYIKPGKIDYSDIEPNLHAMSFRSGAEHFVADMVAKEVRRLVGKNSGDVVVETTLSSPLMQVAHMTLAAKLDQQGQKRNVREAALVSMKPDGAIKALIGGRDYARSQFNRATEAKRQPGSAFKTFVWLSAMERGHQPGTIMQDEPVRYGKWKPSNYDNRFRGPVTLADAFSKSLNTISAKLTVEAGPANIGAVAGRMGINSRLTKNPSLALGTSEVSLLELTAAYAPFANGGLFARPYLIKRIKSAKGKVLYKRNRDTRVTVVKKRELAMMNAMLKSVVEKGTGRAARLKGRAAGGKTGTSQQFRDALFVGYTSQFVTGIWFGNDDNSPTKKLTGGNLPAKAWNEFMDFAHSGLPAKELPGGPALIAAMASKIPTPKPRPFRNLTQTAEVQTVGSVKRQKRKTSTILDLILGNN